MAMVRRNDIIGEALFALTPLALRGRNRELSLTAISTLATLERTGPQRLTDLAAREGITQPSMTAVVTQLADLALAERRGDPCDRRVVLVAITAAGEQYLRTSRRAGASVFTALLDRLTEQDTATLRAALPALGRMLEIADERENRGQPLAMAKAIP